MCHTIHLPVTITMQVMIQGVGLISPGQHFVQQLLLEVDSVWGILVMGILYWQMRYTFTLLSSEAWGVGVIWDQPGERVLGVYLIIAG